MADNLPERVPKPDDDDAAQVIDEQPDGSQADDALTYIAHDLPPNYIVYSPDDAAARKIVGAVVTIGFVVATNLIVIGGLTGRFSPVMVWSAVAELAAAATAVTYFFFRGGS